MKAENVLVRPTVADMIAALQKFPPETPIIIADPDTDWIIDHVHIEERDGRVELTGYYHEMKSR